MKRRIFVAGSAAALAMPAVGHAQSARVFKWIPESDLAVLDPVWTPAYPTRGHAYLVFDMLYGQAGPHGGYMATPQMVAGHTSRMTAGPGSSPCARASSSTTAPECWQGTASPPSGVGARATRWARR
jgi:hypothetical protein